MRVCSLSFANKKTGAQPRYVYNSINSPVPLVSVPYLYPRGCNHSFTHSLTYAIVFAPAPPYTGVVCYNTSMLAVLHTRAFRYALRTATLLALGVLWLYTSLTTTIFWGIFIIWAVWRLDSRYVGAGALVLLVAIPITLSLGEEQWGWLAEQLAVYVFFLLCITVGLQIIEMMTSDRVNEKRVNELPSERDASGRVANFGMQKTTLRVAPTKRRSDTTRTTHDPLLHEHATQTTRYTTPPSHQRRQYASPHTLDLRPKSKVHQV